uniref:Variant surface glycoprotein 443 n=1 Tax=Trypanosoma brucei TaxID=5691 RepID=M4T030_9TRYP|nr:variant surface glycoprotein 443 [Trypanosoma brucei]
MLWVVIILPVLTLPRQTSATHAKAVIHDTNLQNLCGLAANLAAAGVHLKDKIESFKAKIEAEENIRRTALILAGATKLHNLTVRLADAYASIKLAKATQLLADAGGKAAIAAGDAGTVAGAVSEAFSILEQHTKPGKTASAEAVCLTDNANQGAGGDNRKKSSAGKLAQCFSLSGGTKSSGNDPFNYKTLLATAQAGNNLFTSGAAGSGSSGCAVTNIETTSFGKASATLSQLNLAADLIQLTAGGSNDHAGSKLIAHSEVQSKAPKLQTAITSYVTAIKAATEPPTVHLQQLHESNWQAAAADEDLLQAFKDVAAIPPTTAKLPDNLKNIYEDYVKARQQWSQKLEGGKNIDNEWPKYLAARSAWLLEIELAAEKKPTCPTTATKPEEACNAIGDSEAKKCNETDNCHFDSSKEAGKKCTLKKELKEKLEKVNQETGGKDGKTDCSTHQDQKSCEEVNTAGKPATCGWRSGKDNEDEKDKVKCRNGSFLATKQFALSVVSAAFAALLF